MSTPDHEAAIAYALGQLRNGLSRTLTYHNLWHTESDVLPSVARLAAMERVSGRDLGLLRVAAAYHDVGFVRVYEGHEQESVKIARAALPSYQFEPPDIERVATLILSTRLPRAPRDRLEEILDDADLDALGRDDFHARGEALRQELMTRGKRLPWLRWQQTQLELLRGHCYFTTSAKILRDAGVQRNILALEALLGP